MGTFMAWAVLVLIFALGINEWKHFGGRVTNLCFEEATSTAFSCTSRSKGIIWFSTRARPGKH